MPLITGTAPTSEPKRQNIRTQTRKLSEYYCQNSESQTKKAKQMLGLKSNSDPTYSTYSMLADAPPCGDVMDRFCDFICDYNLVAHNASFDKRFLEAELDLISRNYSGEFACSMLAARRIYQNSPNHKLGTLVDYLNIPSDGTFHRALYDSQMTVKLWLAMLDTIQNQHDLEPIPFRLLQKLTKTPKGSVDRLLSSWSGNL